MLAGLTMSSVQLLYTTAISVYEYPRRSSRVPRNVDVLGRTPRTIRLLPVGGLDPPDRRKFIPSVREDGVLLRHESGWDTKTINYYINDPRTPVGGGGQ